MCRRGIVLRCQIRDGTLPVHPRVHGQLVIAASTSFSDDATTLEFDKMSDSDSDSGYSHPTLSKTRRCVVISIHF